MAIGGIGFLIGGHGEEICALNRVEETSFRAAMPVIYHAGVDEGAEERDAKILISQLP